MPGSARERLIGMEQYNSRSFHLITEEAIEAVEAEAVAAERARLRALVEGVLLGPTSPRKWYCKTCLQYDKHYPDCLAAAVLAALEGPAARPDHPKDGYAYAGCFCADCQALRLAYTPGLKRQVTAEGEPDAR